MQPAKVCSQILHLNDSRFPASFRERGVAMPFTAPLLAGARLRDTGSAGAELVLPNPSGGRGVYILPWSRVQERYRPTVHDTVLLRRLANLPELDPVAVRAIAWDVAREGLAGPEARAAAEAALAADRSQQQLVEFLLTHAVVGQVDPHGLKVTSFADRSGELDRQAGAALRRLAPTLGRPAAQLADALTSLGGVFAPIGVTPDDMKSRVARLIARLDDTRDTMMRSFDTGVETDGIRLGRTIVSAMDIVLPFARLTLTAARSLLADPVKLLGRWITSPSQVASRVSRADWLLDGWERICLLWKSAESQSARSAALLEMAELVPTLPWEAMQWSPTPLPRESLDPACRVTCQSDSWRTGGAAFMLVGRNEKLRAMSL